MPAGKLLLLSLLGAAQDTLLWWAFGWVAAAVMWGFSLYHLGRFRVAAQMLGATTRRRS